MPLPLSGLTQKCGIPFRILRYLITQNPHLSTLNLLPGSSNFHLLTTSGTLLPLDLYSCGSHHQIRGPVSLLVPASPPSTKLLPQMDSLSCCQGWSSLIETPLCWKPFTGSHIPYFAVPRHLPQLFLLPLSQCSIWQTRLYSQLQPFPVPRSPQGPLHCWGAPPHGAPAACLSTSSLSYMTAK